MTTPEALPPLPERHRSMLCTRCGYQNPETTAMPPHAPCENSNCQYSAFVSERDYTADQLRAYAEAAIAGERERNAKLCDAKYARHVENGFPREASTARALAAAIRKGASHD